MDTGPHRTARPHLSRFLSTRRCSHVVLWMVVAMAACGRTEKHQPPPRVAADARAAYVGPAPLPTCPGTGHWEACTVFDRLERAGLAPRRGDTIRFSFLKIGGQTWRLGTATLHVFRYRDSNTVGVPGHVMSVSPAGRACTLSSFTKSACRVVLSRYRKTCSVAVPSRHVCPPIFRKEKRIVSPRCGASPARTSRSNTVHDSQCPVPGHVGNGAGPAYAVCASDVTRGGCRCCSVGPHAAIATPIHSTAYEQRRVLRNRDRCGRAVRCGPVSMAVTR